MMAGLYVGVRFTPKTNDLLQKYQHINKIPNPTPIDKFHATVMYSKPDFTGVYDHKGILDQPIVNHSICRPGILGDAVVLKFKSKFLNERHERAKAVGGQWQYPSFIPHVSLGYDVPDNYNTNPLPPFHGPLEIQEEYQEPLQEDWAKSNAAEARLYQSVAAFIFFSRDW